MTSARQAPAAPSQESPRTLLITLAVDIIGPIGGYFVLHALGFSDFWAIGLGGSLGVIFVVVNTARRRKLDAIGLLVLLELALTGVLAAVNQDARLLLVKPALYTVVLGLFFIGGAFIGRPFSIPAIRGGVVSGNERLAAVYDRAWDESPRFRREHRGIALVWGIVWLLESVARVIAVYSFSVGESVWISQVPFVIALVIGVAYARLRWGPIRASLEALARADDARGGGTGGDAPAPRAER